MSDALCPLAIQVPKLRTFKTHEDEATHKIVRVDFRPFAKGQPSAFLFHTGGDGGEKAAAHWNAIGKKKPQALIDLDILAAGPWTPEETFFACYLMDGMGLPHVANGAMGKLVQYASLHLALPHAGTSKAHRKALSTNEWKAWVPDAWEEAFFAMFPRLKSPLELTDGDSANPRTYAMELFKASKRDRETGTYYTRAQYRALARFGVYVSQIAGFELPGFERGVPFGNRKNAKRLLWHELVHPFRYPVGRTVEKGGIDPQILHKEPGFDLDLACSEIDAAKVDASRAMVDFARAKKLAGALS